MAKIPHSDKQMEFKYEHSLAALELRIQLQSDDFAGAEAKSQQYINISAVVIAVIGAFTVSQPALDIITAGLLFVLLAGVVFAFYHALRSITPRKWRQFLNTKEERDKFREWIKTSKDTVYHEAMLNTYMSILEDNDAVLTTKRDHNQQSRRWVYVQLIAAFVFVVYRLLIT